MADNMEDNLELYKKHRPTRLKDVVGQPEAVRAIQAMFDPGPPPRSVLLSGPSGCGKTTMARYFRKKLGCNDRDYREINAASARGIDTIREIQDEMKIPPWKGKSKIYLLDECHRMTTDGQSALLVTLEDTPKHVWMLFCTTEPSKVIKTLRSRCVEVPVKLLSSEHIKQILQNVCAKEKIELSPEEIKAIVECSDCNARKALQTLQKIFTVADANERLSLIQKEEEKQSAFEVVRLLLYQNSTWKDLAKVISALDDSEDWEGIRRMIQNLAGKEMLKCGKNAGWAFLIISCFEDPWFNTGKNGLIRACYDVLQVRK